MTDKEWYAQLSTLVLEGIERLNKGQGTRYNQYEIEAFVRSGETLTQRKAGRRRKVFLNVSEAMRCVGYLGGFIMMVIDGMAWMICLVDGLGLSGPVILLLMAAALGAMGLAGQIWHDLL